MRKYFSPKMQIKLLKNAFKKADKDPFLYNDEELIKLKTSLSKLREEIESTRRFNNGGFGYNA